MTTTMTDLQTGRTHVFNDALPGRDAYEEALALGFEGTRAEWIASLRGLDFDPEKPTWENDRTYPPRAALIHANSFWFARVTNQGVEPGSDGAVWMKLVHGEDAATLADAIDTLTGIRNQANAIANAPQDEPVEGGGFSANHHRIEAGLERAGAEAARDAAGDILALTIATSENLTPISALHDLQFPIPNGWWDTLDRLGSVSSLLSTTSAYAIISNWSPVLLLAGVDGSVPSLDKAFTDTAATTPATWGNSVARINDISGNERNAVQASAALRPLLGRAPVGGRRNLLRHTENFADAYWSKINGLTVTDEGDGVFRLNDADDATPRRYAIRANSANEVMPEGPRTVSVDVKAGTISSVILSQQTSGTQGIGTNSAVFDMASGEFSFTGDGFVATSVAALPDGWFRISASRDDAAAGSSRGFSIGMGGEDYAGDGTGTVFVRFPQAEVGLEATPYQRVGNGFDVTEAGLPSPAFIRFDLSDDVLPTVFPDGGTFDVMLFGRGGSWIERDVTIAAAGSLNIGPSEFTGTSTRLLLKVLGDIVGFTAVDRTLTQAEIDRLVQYHRARGAKGLLVPGPDELSPFTTGFSEFSNLASGWTVSGNNLICSPGASDLNMPIVPTGAAGMYQFILGFDDSHTAVGNITVRFSARESTRTTFAASNAAAGQFTTAIRGTDGSASLRFRPSGPADFVITSLSARKMVPQEEL